MARHHHMCECNRCRRGSWSPPAPNSVRRRNRQVPVEQGDDVKVVGNPDTGITSNFFGGDDGVADGENHGHIDVNEAGEVTYVRDTDVQ